MKLKRTSRNFKRALEDFEKVIKQTEDDARQADDSDMKKMYWGDSRDLRKVRSLFRRRRFEEAYDLAWMMDTAARDIIPQYAWDIMHVFE